MSISSRLTFSLCQALQPALRLSPFTMNDDEIILNIDPPIWNVVKFLALAVLAAPLLELLLHRVVDSKATYDVLNGKHLSCWETKLSIFSLHSSYWGPVRNKIILLFIALPILAADLLVEFSFSAATVDVSEQVQVWLQPPHQFYYLNSSADRPVIADRTSVADPSQFPPETAPKCIQGPRALSISQTNNTSDDVDEYISGFEYRMNGTYVIRNSYLTADNKTIVCSAAKRVGQINFVFPDVVQVRGYTRGEGVNPSGNTTHSDQLRAVYSQQPLQYIGKTTFPTSEVEIWISENVTCGAPQDFGQLCSAMVGQSFVLFNGTRVGPETTVFNTETALSNATLSVIVSASGAPIQGMRNPARRIRFLASLAGSRLLTSYIRGDQPSQRLITKDTLEQISFMIMYVANEEGVGGERQQKGFRAIKRGEKQSATMKRMAFIPIGILLFSVLALVAVDLIYFALITWKLRKNGVKPGSIRKVRARTKVKLSIQWLAERVLDDLKGVRNYHDASPSDVSAKHVVHNGEEWFQILPVSSTQHRYGHAS